MKEYISKDEIIEHFSKRVSCPSGEDNSKERYRYIQWVTDYNSIISIPAVKAIPLDVVKQIVEEMYEEIANYENVQTENFLQSTGVIENSNTFGELRGVTRTKNIVEKYMNKLMESEK